MNSLFVIPVVVMIAISFLPAFAQSQQRLTDKDLFVMVQMIVRNSDGQLVTYLESYRTTITSLKALDEYINADTKLGKDPVVDVNGQLYQLIKRSKVITFESDSVLAMSSMGQSKGNSLEVLAYFDHDGIPVVKGDSVTMIWTIIRPVH